MPRVLGIDPGSVSIDVCGLADGRLYLDTTWPTAEALADPGRCIAELAGPGLPDLVVGPSGYGLPLCRAADATEEELRLAFLAAPEETGGIGGLRGFARRLALSGLPVMYTPGVIHLDTVPEHRKLNRVDLGTADKLCAAALAIADQQRRTGRSPAEVSLILLELGGAFSAALAVHRGQVVDGLGGSSGPIGWQSAGALDGEVAFLAERVTKALLFHGGVQSVARGGAGQATALDAYVEGAVKAVRQLQGRSGSMRDLPAPTGESFWTTQKTGKDVNLDWDFKDEDNTIVLMNADGTPAVRADGSVEVKIPRLSMALVAGIVFGLILFLLGLLFLMRVGRRRRTPQATGYPIGGDPTPSPT